MNFKAYRFVSLRLKERAQQLKMNIPAVAFALKRKETPVLAKIFAGVAVAYALSPIDLIPDFIPVLGYLDDVILLPVLIGLTVKLIPENIFIECRQQAVGWYESGVKQKWYYAVPIILFWLFIIFILIKVIWL